MFCSNDVVNRQMSKILAKTKGQQSTDWLQKLKEVNITTQELQIQFWITGVNGSSFGHKILGVFHSCRGRIHTLTHVSI